MPHTIVVVEDNPITRKMMMVALRSAGYVVFGAEDGHSALAMVEEVEPDLVVLDLMLPDMDGIELGRRIRGSRRGRACVLVALSGLTSKMEEARCEAQGFDRLLVKPIEPSQLVEVFDGLLPQATPAGRGANRLVLLVNGDPVQSTLYRLQLEERGFRVMIAGDGMEALAEARHNPPDAIVSDHLMPDMDGFDLCLLVREDPALARVPFVLTSASGISVEASDLRLARSVGANALIARAPNLDEVIRAVLAGLDGQLATVPAALPPFETESLKAQYMARIARQLEEQSRLRQSWVQEAAAKTAQLSIMTAVAGVMAQDLDLDALLHEMLARTLDAAGVPSGAIYLTDSDGRTQLASQLGYPLAQAKRLGDFFGRLALLDAVLSTGRPMTVPSTELGEPAGDGGVARCMLLPLVAAGQRLGVLVIASARRDFGDEWVEIAMAIGVQMAQAVAHARSMARLRESEQHYRTLFEGVPVGLYRTAPNGEVLDVNTAMAQLLGYPDRESLLSVNIATVYAHPEDRTAWRAQVERAPVAGGVDVEARRLDGTTLWVRNHGRAVRAADGSVRYYEGSLEDITAHRFAARERDLALARAETANASKSKFLAVMSHELRTPLNAVAGYVDLIQDGIHGSLTSGQADALSRVKHNSQHLLGMISEILEFTQVDGGHAVLRDASVPVSDLLTRAEALVAPQFMEKGLALSVGGCEPSLTARADPEKLTQVVVNLLANALKFTPPGGRVSLGCDADDATIAVRVVDTGPGIAPEHLERIFEPFYQADRTLTRTQGGIGLGLAISRDLVRAMQGDISVASTPGQGAAFTVTLPRVR